MIDAAQPQDEQQRLASLAACRILDSTPEPAFDDLAALAARLLEAPIALVSLIDADRQWFKSRYGLEQESTPRKLAFCAHAILEPRKLFLVEDATLDERFADNPLVTGEPGIRFYAGAPLLDIEGRALGTLCVIDRRPRKLDEVQRETLAALARQVSRLIELRRANIDFAELAETHADARRELEQREERLRLANEFLEDARSCRDVKALLTSGLTRVQRRIPFSSVTYAKLSAEGALEVVHSVAEEGAALTGGTSMSLRTMPLLLGRLVNRQDVVVQDAAREPELAGAQDSAPFLRGRAFLLVPTRHKVHGVGVFCVEARRPRRWSEHELALVRSAAGRLEILMERLQSEVERKAAEDALRASEERWQLALAGNNDGIWDWNLLTNAVFFSARWKSMLGHGPDELADHVDTWKSRVHPEDLERTLVDLQAHLDGRTELYENEHRLRAKDGTYRWILDRGKALRDGTGQAVRMVGSHTDVTARKHAELALRESEERFRGLCDSSPMLVWMSNADAECEWFNQGWLAFTGRAIEQELGHGWFEGVHPDDRERCTKTWLAANAAQREFAVEYRLRNATGLYRWIYDIGRPRRDDAGSFVGFVGCCIDIDERKRLEQDLAIARDGALEAVRVKSQFIANMSHELRTPLNGVLGMANVLALGDLDSEQRSCVESLHASAEDLLSIVSEVLDFAQFESGTADVRCEAFDLHALLEELDRTSANHARARGLEWSGPGVSTLPQAVVGDAKLLRRVLEELVGNAVKFTERGSVRLVAKVEERVRGESTLRFDVVDTGPGIPADEQLRLFRSFHQVDSSTTRKHGGLGLGLALARKVVDRLGGDIGVRSTPGEGSTFWLRIPLRRPALDVEAPEAALPARVAAGPLPQFQGRVLVVEDNALNQRVACRLLERLGLRVEVANNGARALEASRKGEFRLVFMDCHMPEMDGFEATRRWRAEETEGVRVPIVALSATTLAEERARCLECGMDGFLSKPFLIPELVLVLQRHLRSSPAVPAGVEAQR
ncbi:MAG: PAS domain-containing protein [Planctomycetes bacterium]|nr:PAS domain-containing protein [Planctomycetota bacterium]